MDIVIPVGQKCGWGDYQELKYALRSAQEFVPDLGRAWIVGYCPGWLNPKYHLPAIDPYKHNKDANLIQKVAYACGQPELSDRFIRMSDDQLFLAPFEDVLWYLEELTPNSFDRSPKKWYNRLRNTYEGLRTAVSPIYNFDSHVPMVYDKKKFLQIAMSNDYGADPGMCINTMYANRVGGVKKKLPEGARWGVSAPLSKQQLLNGYKNAILCNYVDRGLSDTFKEIVMERFDTPSKFEV